VCGSVGLVWSSSLLIRWAHRARCQAETPLIALCRFPGPALSSIVGKVGSQHRLRADEGIPVGDDREVDGVQARHRDRENLAAIEGENQLPKVVQRVRIQNGIDVVGMPAHHAA
jgi:hypothetical protein